MENVNAVSLGTIMTTIALLDSIKQSQLNVLVKDIIKLHRNRKINASFNNLAKEFGETLEIGPTKFTTKVQEELHLISSGSISSFLELRNECPLVAYVLIANIKVIATFDICKTVNSRIYAAYTAAVQSLDGLL